MKLKDTPWKKSYDQPRQRIKKQRYYFVNKGLSSQSYGFPSSHVCMWELDYKECWVRRIDDFELWCWQKVLRVPWTARRSNQSILKEISSECSLEGLMFNLKLQYFGHLMWRTGLIKDPDVGKDWRWEEKETTDNRLNDITDSMDMNLSKVLEFWWTGSPGVLKSIGLQRVGQD